MPLNIGHRERVSVDRWFYFYDWGVVPLTILIGSTEINIIILSPFFWNISIAYISIIPCLIKTTLIICKLKTNCLFLLPPCSIPICIFVCNLNALIKCKMVLVVTIFYNRHRILKRDSFLKVILKFFWVILISSVDVNKNTWVVLQIGYSGCCLYISTFRILLIYLFNKDRKYVSRKTIFLSLFAMTTSLYLSGKLLNLWTNQIVILWMAIVKKYIFIWALQTINGEANLFSKGRLKKKS